MSVDAMIQTFLLNESDNAADIFLAQFDSDWKRYNRDLIRKVQQYQKESNLVICQEENEKDFHGKG